MGDAHKITRPGHRYLITSYVGAVDVDAAKPAGVRVSALDQHYFSHHSSAATPVQLGIEVSPAEAARSSGRAWRKDATAAMAQSAHCHDARPCHVFLLLGLHCAQTAPLILGSGEIRGVARASRSLRVAGAITLQVRTNYRVVYNVYFLVRLN